MLWVAHPLMPGPALTMRGCVRPLLRCPNLRGRPGACTDRGGYAEGGQKGRP